ncbi:DUF1559 family PulG-like putative transporter [Stieleria varia]|uniref:DUF1559 domain-containing protein n=1 Tax=Stieleria varia TaxID=2528005 RepID=A0A5C6A1W8_9BACT|nr:DUF1559 domain-containing protein [Stieleria varia]TWT93228.1 hypothetical protein Pla52n_58850 [Stieleria varia]
MRSAEHQGSIDELMPYQSATEIVQDQASAGAGGAAPRWKQTFGFVAVLIATGSITWWSDVASTSRTPAEVSSDAIELSAKTADPDAESKLESLDDFVQSYSMHRGGAHVLMDDGAVKFIHDKTDESAKRWIEDPTSDGPYGLWGALGTKSDAKAVEGQQANTVLSSIEFQTPTVPGVKK